MHKTGGSVLFKKGFVALCFLLFPCHIKTLSKWCSSGVVSTISRREIIDVTDFSGTFQDTAVTIKQYYASLVRHDMANGFGSG